MVKDGRLSRRLIDEVIGANLSLLPPRDSWKDWFRQIGGTDAVPTMASTAGTAPGTPLSGAISSRGKRNCKGRGPEGAEGVTGVTGRACSAS